jgi:hypothetical protein
MKLLSLSLFILVYTNDAQAFAPAYDTNCLEKAKEKNLIKHYYTDEDWLRRYDFEKIKDNFHQTQDKVSKQIKAWKEISKEHYCLEDVSGIQFVDNKLVITDYDKYESFRLNKSRIDCDTDVNSFGFKPKDKPYQEYVNPNDNTTVIRDNKNVSTAKNKIENPDENLKKRQEQADKVDGLVKVLKDLGDVGFDNYCAHQLYKGGIADRIESVTKSFNNCKKAADNGDKDYINKSCGNYPSFFVGKLEELDRIAKSTEVDLGRDTSQPLFMVNEMDNKIYAKFKNNLDELKRAKEEANNEYEELLKIKNFKKHTSCDPDSPWMKSVSDGYSLSECYYSPAIFGQNDLELTDHKNILKYKHRNDMIEEVNHNIFKQTMMAKFYTLSDTEQKDVLSLVKTNPKGACEKMLPDPSAISKLFKNGKEAMENLLFLDHAVNEALSRENKYSYDQLKSYLCSDQVRNSNGSQIKSNYLDFLKEGLKEVAANPNSSFLKKDSGQVQKELNAQITVLESFCQLKDKLRSGRTSLGIDSDDEAKAYKNLIAQKMQETIEKLKKTENAKYLLTKTLGSKFKFDSYNPEYESCESDRHFRYPPNENFASNKIELKDIEEAREEFVDAIDKQLLSVVNRTDSYRGDNKNALAEMACRNSAKHAEDNFAIYQMYKSHPYLMGQVLAHQDSSVSSVKQAILCEAIECYKSVDNMNKAIVGIARGGALAVSVLAPGVGTAAGVAINTAINVATGTFELYDKWNEGVVDSQLMMSGAASGGYGPVEEIFKNKIDALLAEKNVDADTKKFLIDMAAMISTEALSAVSGMKKLDPLKNKMAKLFAKQMGKSTLSNLEKEIFNSLVDSFAAKVITFSGTIAKGEVDEISDFVPTSSKDFILATSLLLSEPLNAKIKNLDMRDLSSSANVLDYVYNQVMSDGEEETVFDEPLYNFATSELGNRKTYVNNEVKKFIKK